jgi:creatinine amidohydrolase
MSYSARPWVLSETTWRDVGGTQYDVAILPWGATEAHNYHLPYATDNIETQAVAEEAARIAWHAGARVIVLPTVPFGVQTGQLDIPFCMNIMPSTQAALLGDLVHALQQQGIRRLVILNGHGGNDFKAMIRELQPATAIFLCVVDWYRVVDARELFDEPGDHAGELETSLMQHLAPQLVRPLEDAGPGTQRHFRVAALREGWAWAPRHWRAISDDTGVGNPAGASREKGAAYFAVVTQRIAAFLQELAAAEPDRMYEDG